VDARIGRLGEGIKATRIRKVVFRYGLGDATFVATGQIDHGPNVLPVHDGEKFLGSSKVFTVRGEFHSLF
jgi:hypothetical protein